MSKSLAILESAKTLAATADTWADLSNALFDPIDGLLAKAFPTREQRAAFVQSDEYKQIRKLLGAAVARTGRVEGATPKKSGRFIVRLPQSLHAALEHEAEQEGVSLNQLVVVKLAVQLSNLSSGSQSQMGTVIQSYLEVREGYSTDFVVADPDFNRRFLRRCRELGAAGTDFDLNWALFNARKNRHLTDIPKTKRFTVSRIDEYEYASEMAVRFVQRQVQEREHCEASLDKIICDPELAAEFDRLASRIASGFSPIEYRWVALGLRKAARRLTASTEVVELPKLEMLGSTKTVRPSRLPTEQGLYLFQCDDEAIFLGETDNLRHRIERHFDTSEDRGLPDWLYDPGRRAVRLGIAHLPGIRSTTRRAMELRGIRDLRPIFNYLYGPSHAA
jgi:site-specific DNA-methyltransferase (adenine-specific)